MLCCLPIHLCRTNDLSLLKLLHPLCEQFLEPLQKSHNRIPYAMRAVPPHIVHHYQVYVHVP